MTEQAKTESAAPKKPRPKSRPDRWKEAAGKARKAFDDLQAAFSELNDLRTEYEEWKDGQPENLQGSALGEKLEAVCELDFENALDEAEGVLNEAEAIDLPLGFGRD